MRNTIYYGRDFDVDEPGHVPDTAKEEYPMAKTLSTKNSGQAPVSDWYRSVYQKLWASGLNPNLGPGYVTVTFDDGSTQKIYLGADMNETPTKEMMDEVNQEIDQVIKERGLSEPTKQPTKNYPVRPRFMKGGGGFTPTAKIKI
jgi:hypothetical protein